MKENDESYSEYPIFWCSCLEIRRQGFFVILIANFEFFESVEAGGDLIKGFLGLYLEQRGGVQELDCPLNNEVADLLQDNSVLVSGKTVANLDESDDPDRLGVGRAVGVYEAEEVEEDGEGLSEITIFRFLHLGASGR